MTIRFTGLLCASALVAPLCAASDLAHADVVISGAATSNMSCVSGVCTPTSPNAVLNVNDLETMLVNGNVSIEASAEPVDIDVQVAFSWSSASSLTLDSYHSVSVGSPVAVTGNGGLSVITNDGGTGGWFTFAPNANVEFSSLSSNLSINGTPYMLAGDIKTLASDIAANPSGNFALATDYNATPDGTYSASAISTNFLGNFQGLGNTISNLAISTKGRVGYLALFVSTGADATISNLVLANASVSGDKSNAAGLVGSNVGTLFGSHTSGRIKTLKGGSAGGLAALNQGAIIASSSSATVSGREESQTGGLVGHNEGVVNECFATGATKLINAVGNGGALGGGLVGLTENNAITNSYATGATQGSGNAGIGGLIGGIEFATVGTSYSTGRVSGAQINNEGGFVAFVGSDVSVSNSYWDTQTSGMSNAGGGNQAIPGVTGLTTKQLKSGLPSGFDPTIWAQSKSINNGFPYLIANPPQ